MSVDLLLPTTEGKASCVVCGEAFHWLGDHVIEKHNLDLEEYLTRYPGSPTVSREAFRVVEKKRGIERVEATPVGVTTKFAGISFPVHTNVPSEACLPMPAHYRIPEKGVLSADVQDAALAVSRGRSVWIWGPPGTGKDALISALCASTRRPSLLFTVIPGADVTSWKYTRSFDANGTSWEEGVLLRALRDGYQPPDGGARIPYLIVLSDFDRATRQQAEELRQILDSIQGRITGPTGIVWPTFPGTTLVATANTPGSGDPTGRYLSANPIDASILDRFERKIRFHPMEKDDEIPILQAKFPLLAKSHLSTLKTVVSASASVRSAIEKDLLYCEWSHRTVCAWLGALEDLLLAFPGGNPSQFVSRALRVVLDGMPDEDTRENARRVIDPLIAKGTLDEGDVGHIQPDVDLGKDWRNLTTLQPDIGKAQSADLGKTWPDPPSKA